MCVTADLVFWADWESFFGIFAFGIESLNGTSR